MGTPVTNLVVDKPKHTRYYLFMANTKRDKLAKELETEAATNGHTLTEWTKGRWGFHSQCVNCSAHVAFTASTGAVRERESIQENCAERAARIKAYRSEAGI